ncbi:MAG TPA: cell division protein FtsA [Candidatus Krumholzibacteria bacterium]|nr:cell division protein FtsA [Candidatus Krumholzibacteria bacterium]HPD72786.1 cell division protein FtsA [Candidatus Krumholzibacteria bacterium]HRY40282.1 cell division protein FtsA [Candidatus Krumholzibacteria bacterium]
MSEGNLVVACDFGTTTFRALVAEVGSARPARILAGAVASAEGFQDGDFVDVKAGSLAIARLIREVQEAANVDISGFSFNITGSHLRSVMATGQIPIGQRGRDITGRDVDEVMTMARSLTIPFNHRILTVNPVEFSVDRVGGILDPRGRVGSRLEVKAHLITGSCSVIRNIENAIDKAGFEPAGHAVDILAAATALLTPAERERGVILIDVGGEVTHWAALAGGRLLGIGATPWGGQHLTGDLASGLRIPVEAAAVVKEDRGVVLRSLVEEVDVNVLFEQEDPAETPGLIAAVLEPRLEEIFSLVKDTLGPELPLSRFASGIVLTGGGSRCRGSRELCEEVFGMPARSRYLPEDLEGVGNLPGGQWATALGLALWSGGSERAQATQPPAADAAADSWRGKLRRMLSRGAHA